MTWFHPHDVSRRLAVGRGVVLAVIGVLVLAFFRVQVLSSARYALQSEENRLRPVMVTAARGLIVDRNGQVLAENVPGYSVALRARSVDQLLEAIDRLGDLLPLEAAEREDVVARYRQRPSEPVVVRRDAPFDVVSALEERRVWTPGLVIVSDPQRRYPFGALGAHVVGYVGEITETELRSGNVAGSRPGLLVGRDGVESAYDDRLRGRDGIRYVEEDALGRTIRDAAEEAALPPEPGETIATTVDLALQQYVAETFPAGRRGAVMAVDPRSGEILALYSAPSYDPNVFVGRVDQVEWRRLRDSEDQPLFNRATQGRYAPASPFKLAIAAMALQRGIVTMDSHMEIPCRGGLQYYNRYFRCWRVDGHGDMTLTQAIQFSCDVYFYQLGLKLGLDALLADAVGMGFREPSGIDLPSESRPTFPPSIEYYNQRYGPRGWTNAVALNLAIGQGENAQTLANMVRFYMMLASPDGSAPEPRLVAGAPGRARSLGLSWDALEGLRNALTLVVEEGTAAGAQLANLRVAGKTGTAQNPHGPDHGWFIGFAPAENPEIVVGAIEEFAEHGSAVAPFVTRIIARHLLGAEAVAGRPTLVMPADSAPEPVPILPDTSLLSPPPDSSRDRAPGRR